MCSLPNFFYDHPERERERIYFNIVFEGSDDVPVLHHSKLWSEPKEMITAYAVWYGVGLPVLLFV